MAFDILKAVGDLQPKESGRPHMEEIELHLIDKNPGNFYSMDGIEELADNIRMFGLMEPLIVKRTDSGRYMLISGHRRRAALCRLADDGTYSEGMHHKVDCLVTSEPAVSVISDPDKAEEARGVMEQLRLLYANADTRVLSSADTAMQVRRIRELLTKLKELGYPVQGRMRDIVAEAAKVSASRVARLDVIERDLVDPRLRTAWKHGDLQESSAYEIAKYEPEVQKHMTNNQVRHVCDLTKEGVQAFMSAVEADWDVCRRLPPENVSTVDTIGKDFQKEWEDRHERICEILDQEDEDFFYALAQIKDMFFNDLSCLNNRNEGIERLKKIFGLGHHGGTRDWGSYDCTPKGLTVGIKKAPRKISRSWTEVYDLLCTLALTESSERVMEKRRIKPKAENVSTVDTSAGWQKGDPPKRGRYLVTVDLGGGELHEHRFEWTGDRWLAFGGPLDPAFKVVAWFPLPDEMQEV